MSVADAAAMKIVTIEGLAGKPAEAVRAAWRELDVPQCRYCQPGQIMSATALLAGMPRRAMLTSTARWTATSAAARPIIKSVRAFIAQPKS